MKQWTFTESPTGEQVLDLLNSMDDVFGVPMASIAEFVQPLPQKKKVEVESKAHTRKPVKVTEYRNEWTLYVSVAGRLKLLQLCAQKNNWRVTFKPEPKTPTKAPGFISLEQRIVYREYVEIWAPIDPTNLAQGQYLLGSKSGQAWVPFSGGQGAAGSNPYEKVETAARGRALAAWGLGVLPGSGVASLEEMTGQSRTDTADQQKPDERLDRDELEARFREQIEEARQLADMQPEQMFTEMAKWIKQVYNIGVGGKTGESGEVVDLDLAAVKAGQLKLICNAMQKRIDDKKAAS